MALAEMSPKERWLAALHLQPVDHLPFWPKLDAAYPRAQSMPFQAMEINAIHNWIGSDKHVWIPACYREVRGHAVTETITEGMARRTLYRTPLGETVLVSRFDVPSQAWHPVQFPIQDLDDIKIMTAFFEDTVVELDQDVLAETQAQARVFGQDALVCTGIGESPLMYWVEWLAGIEQSHYLLADHQPAVEALFEAIHRVLLRRTEVLAEHSPADVLYFIENTSTTLISPKQYRTYCYKHIHAYGEITREYGRILILHMCGHLKALLPDLATLPVEAFEAFTSPTLGNTTLRDGRSQCPDKCLIGGTNAMLWTKSSEHIIAQIERDLADLPHHRGVVVTSAGVMPPLCTPETIKAVCEWVKTYAARV